MGARPCVLLVEDDPDSLEILRELLSSRYDVRTATSGEEAVLAASREGVDLIVSDVYLPQMDGLTMLDTLRQSPQTSEVPVVFLSARREEGLVVDCLERGAADFIPKPPGCQELFARIDRTLRERRHQVHLAEIAQTDELTGLFNFRALSQRLAEEFQRANRYDHPLSVVMLDLDYLKELNDRFGHEVGNQAIAALGRLLRAELRQADFAARYGGDEFIVLLPHQAPEAAASFAERLRTRLAELELVDDNGAPVAFRLSASVGVAGISGRAEVDSAEALLRAADRALYEAKRRGRDRVAVYGREVAPDPYGPHPHA
jgi:diguanylate cyclase (GGDEF)-like protein